MVVVHAAFAGELSRTDEILATPNTDARRSFFKGNLFGRMWIKCEPLGRQRSFLILA
jgi:hypothetical protein